MRVAGVPFRVEVFRIDRAEAEIRRVAEIGVGRAEVEVDRLVGVERGAARRVELVDVIVARLQAVLIGGANRGDQAVQRPARAFAVAPRELVTVLFVEALRLVPRVTAALAVVDERRRSSPESPSAALSWCQVASAAACSSWIASTASWPARSISKEDAAAGSGSHRSRWAAKAMPQSPNALR